MAIKIDYRNRTQITARAIPTWLNIVADYKSGMPIKEITKRYVNPNTGKKVTSGYIYWVLKRVQSL